MSKTRRRQPLPWDLFHQPPQAPTWEQLPRAVQSQLRELLANLLREQRAAKAPPTSDKEDGHE